MRETIEGQGHIAPRRGAEMRGAERFTLLIRTAKLVCESGEFLCVIRDVSETGVRLRLFHSLPQDSRMALELGNGAVYFIERVWERDSHAGFRFAAPIDVRGFIAEVSPYPRRQLRLRIAFAADLMTGALPASVSVRDLSTQGARIACARYLAIGQPVRLEAGALPAIFAKVAWRRGEDYGLVFEQVFSFEALAMLAAKIHGLGEMTGAVAQLRAG